MAMRVARTVRRNQRGQSLVEVCVACIALVPLAIGLVYVGQYIHIKQTVQQASREAAWDAAISPSVYQGSAPGSNTEQTRLRARYFGDAETRESPIQDRLYCRRPRRRPEPHLL